MPGETISHRRRPTIDSTPLQPSTEWSMKLHHQSPPMGPSRPHVESTNASSQPTGNQNNHFVLLHVLCGVVTGVVSKHLAPSRRGRDREQRRARAIPGRSARNMRRAMYNMVSPLSDKPPRPATTPPESEGEMRGQRCELA